MSDSVSNTRLARLSASGSSSTTSSRYEGSGTIQMLPPSLIIAQGTDILFDHGLGETRARALQRGHRSSCRGGSTPRSARRRRAQPHADRAGHRLLLGGAGDHPLHHRRLRRGVLPGEAAAGHRRRGGADALILLLLFGLRRRAFDHYPWLPFALLAGVICNVTEAVNLLLTGGAESDFVFPYYLISFGIAILFPAPLPAVTATAGLLPLGYLAVAVAAGEPLGAKHFVSNLMLLSDTALITCIGNRVVTNLFLREIKLRIDLEKANERLRELDRLKTEFFANVSHELRTPLTLILAPASSLSRESHGKLAPGQRQFVDTIHRNATRLLQLINDLLLLAKLESGEPRIDRVPVDVGACILRVIQEAQAYAQSLELRLDVEVEPGGPYIWSGDERHLDRIALNLVSNACKFSKAGGVVRVGVGSDRE